MKITVAAVAFASGSAVALASAAEIRTVAGAKAIDGSYIVVLKDGMTVPPGGKQAGLTLAQVSVDFAARYGGRVTHRYDRVLNGFAVELPEAAARRLALDPRVEYVEQDAVMHALAVQNNPPSYGLDRIDQRSLPLSGSYNFNFDGTGVHAYVIDTGIRASHQEFAGRMGNGFTAVNDGQGTNDCNGHGTHVAGTIGGTNVGVAKRVTLHAVRVLGCTGSGSTSGIIAGINFVTQNGIRPAVANMSLGGGASTALDNAVANSVAAGVVHVVAAGNSNNNACGGSPARAPSAITVAATTSTDARSSFSSFGPCVDIFAPGSSITSAWINSNTSRNTISGTSMASPHVAGVAALVLHQNRSLSPAGVTQAIVGASTPNRVSNPGSGSPNRLLFSLIGGPSPNPTPTPQPSPNPTPTPTPTPTPDPGGAPAWQPNTSYTIGQVVSHQGIRYTCRQSHTSQVGWEPPIVLALWLPQ